MGSNLDLRHCNRVGSRGMETLCGTVVASFVLARGDTSHWRQPGDEATLVTAQLHWLIGTQCWDGLFGLGPSCLSVSL